MKAVFPAITLTHAVERFDDVPVPETLQQTVFEFSDSVQRDDWESQLQVPVTSRSRSFCIEGEVSLQQHTVSNQLQEDIIHECTFLRCNFKAHTKSALRRHMCLHKGERPYKCHVPGCPRTFSQAGHLQIHLRGHSKEKSYPRNHPGCEYKTSTPSRPKEYRALHAHKKSKVSGLTGCLQAHACASGPCKDRHKEQGISARTLPLHFRVLTELYVTAK